MRTTTKHRMRRMEGSQPWLLGPLMALALAVGLYGSFASVAVAHPAKTTVAPPPAAVPLLHPASRAEMQHDFDTFPGAFQVGKTVYGPEVQQPGACMQPAALDKQYLAPGQDRASLPDSVLALYGIPARPDKASAIGPWATAVRALRVHVWTSRTVNHTADNKTIWAGNQDYNSSAPYTWAAMNWYVPCLLSGSLGGTFSNVWVGDGSSELVQTGTEQDMENGSPNSAWYYAWTENYPYQSEQVDFGVGCGDTMYAYVSGGNCMFIEDETTHMAPSPTCVGPSFDKVTADYIVERPTVNGGMSDLADFQYASLYNTNNSAPGVADAQQHVGYWMVDDYTRNDVCAAPGPWNNDAFTVTFVTPNNPCG